MESSVVGFYNSIILHISFYSSIISTIINAILVIGVLLRAKRRPAYVSFFFLLVGFLVWNFFSIIYFNYAISVDLGYHTAKDLSTPVLDHLRFLERLNCMGLLIIGTFTMFTVYYLTYSRYEWLKKLSYFLFFLTPFSFMILFSPLYNTVFWSIYYSLTIFAPGMVAAVMFFISYKKEKTYYKKKRFYIIFWASLIMVIAGITNVLNGYVKAIPPLSSIVSIFYLIMVFYVVVEIHLFKIRYVVFRIIFYIVISLVFTAIATVFFFYIVQTESVYVKIFLIFVFIMSTIVLYESFQPIAVKIFKLPGYNFKRNTILSLIDFYEKIGTLNSRGEVINTFVEYVAQIIGASGIGLYIKSGDIFLLKNVKGLEIEERGFDVNSSIVQYFSKHTSVTDYLIRDEIGLTPWAENKILLSDIKKWMDNNDVEVIIPINDVKETIGFVVVGYKVNMVPYSMEDLEIVKLLFSSLNLVLSNFFLSSEINRFAKELDVSKKEVENLRNAKLMSDVIRGVIHDIKNMLTSLKGRMDIIEMDPFYSSLPLSLRGQISSLRKTVDRTLNVTKKFVGFSKDISNVFPLEEIHLSKFIEELYRDWEGKCIEYKYSRNLEINIDINIPNDIVIKSSKMDLQRIMDNLVYNAIDAVVEKGDNGNVTIRANYEDSETVKIEVEDTGIGIKKEDEMNMFKLFFTTKDTGTGVGLSTVKSIITGMGGTISFESEYGKGTVFKVILPKEGKK